MPNANEIREPPWVSGPKEILLHGLRLLEEDTDVNRRLAIISIDNAVELTMKTYLGLPRRITGIPLGRKQFQAISESFPQLLDALDDHCSEKLEGIELGEIEWYHRLRNELYHNGNGLTVEYDKVLVYSELARALFKNLFGVEITIPKKKDRRKDVLGSFINQWVILERTIKELFDTVGGIKIGHDNALTQAMGAHEMLLQAHGYIDKDLWIEIDDLRDLRNKVIHGQQDIQKLIDEAANPRVRKINETLAELIRAQSQDTSNKETK